VDAFLAGMDRAQVDEWLGFMLLEPSGGAADDERFARLLAMTAGTGRPLETYSLAWRPAPEKPPTPAEIILAAQAQAQGGAMKG
jgi:hypothetical protein